MTATTIAQLEMDDVRKKIDLEIEQNRLRLKDANKQLATSQKNMAAAEENLRCANVGFKEGLESLLSDLEGRLQAIVDLVC